MMIRDAFPVFAVFRFVDKAQGFNPELNGAKLGTEWLLSRRDRLIVARHEVPGIDVKRLRPGGTVEVIVSPNVSRIGSIVPLGRGHFPRDSRHFVPGYYRAVPPGQNQSPSKCLELS